MRDRQRAIALGVVLVLGGSTGALAAGEQQTAGAVQKSGAVAYFSGGVGSDERARMEQMAAGFNLRVEMAAPAGNYQGGGHVVIRDAARKTVLDTTTDGPLLYVKLPPGHYTVDVSGASAAGPGKTRAVDLTANERKDVVLALDAGPDAHGP